MTREQFLHRVLEIGLARLNDEKDRSRLRGVKLVYGSGEPGLYGRCYYDAWHHERSQDFIEVSAHGEQSVLQLAATVLHELAHTLAGRQAGHGPGWRHAARLLGLAHPQAVGWDEHAQNFAPDILAQLAALAPLTDGKPAFHGTPPAQPRPCPSGNGTRGGSSRGPGSGRLRLYECACQPPVKARVARDEFHAHCTDCNSAFKRKSPLKEKTK